MAKYTIHRMGEYFVLKRSGINTGCYSKDKRVLEKLRINFQKNARTPTFIGV